MASHSHMPHFLLFPFMAQGHMIPMIDLAKLLAHRRAIITIVTTPLNFARYHSVLTRAIDSGLQINVVQLQFPWSEQSGISQGCENVDMLPSLDSFPDFLRAASLLYEPCEELFEQLTPRPNCIISDMCLPWTFQLANKFNVPRLVFYSLSFFFLICMRRLTTIKDVWKSTPESEFVTLSNMPHSIKFLKSQLPHSNNDYWTQFSIAMAEADRQSHGVVMNLFEEMEPEYLVEYKKEIEFPERVWCVGPLSFSNNHEIDKVERGNKSVIDKHECIDWLNGQNPSSIVYVSFGSLCNLEAVQLIELGLGLEALKRPFIWVIRKANLSQELLKWLVEYDFEEKVKGRGLVIRGWAPQVLILSHPAIGCFMTHCGWNSSIEGISAGVPMITWPLFADQLFNEKLIVDILKVGVSVKEETFSYCGEIKDKQIMVKREKIREIIEMVIDGDERHGMRQRCIEVAEKAKIAMEKGGSSQRNLKLMIEDIIAHCHGESSNKGN